MVDETGKEKALESGSKVACIVSKVLFYEQVRALQKSAEWYVSSLHLSVANDRNMLSPPSLLHYLLHPCFFQNYTSGVLVT